MCGVVLRARLFRQGTPRRGIATAAVCMVQTETGTALCSSPAREQHFAVIHFFWDRILGTYRRPDAGQSQMDGTFGPASERRQGCVRFGTSVPKLTPARRLYAGEGIERPDPSAQLCDSAHPWKSHVQKVRAGFSWEDRSIA